MKRILISTFVLLLLLVTSLSLFACGECVHSFGEWETKTAATCTQDGVRSRTCTECGQTEEEPTSKLSHSFVSYTQDGNATCMADGTESAKCENCDATDTKTVAGSKKPHSFTNYVNDNNATCSSDATKTAVCDTEGCGATHSLVIENTKTDHVLSSTDNAPSCTGDVVVITSCANCDYTISEIIPAIEHDWDYEAPTCERGIKCSRCEASKPALSHTYSQKSVTEADCENDGIITYACSVCSDEYEVIKEHAKGHTTGAAWTLKSERKADGESCLYVQTYKSVCTVCNSEIEKEEEVEKHVYKASIKTDALCNKEGVKTYTCTNVGCTHTYDESYTDSTAHAWGTGVVNGKVTTYTCQNTGCTESKSTLSYQEETSATVDKSTLESAGEVELKDASIALDDKTLSGLSGDVKISADKLSASDLEISGDLLTAIGNRPVYNFGMQMNNSQVTTFNGLVTVRVPYTLSEGEDPECIAIWYINEEGEVESIKATYSSGYAVFETSHFSYYTVTRLSPIERCNLYGHSYKITVKAPGCVTEGYTIKVCQRCGASEKSDILPPTGHSFTSATTEATCEFSGNVVYTCAGCQETYSEKLPALGHNYQKTSETFATCTEIGKANYVCSRCEDEYIDITSKLPHAYVDSVTEATCTTAGYRDRKCSDCGFEIRDSHVEALGHNYISTVIAPTCTTDGYTNHKCSRCDDEYATDVVVASHKWDIDAPTCGKGQTCLVCSALGAPATGEHNIVDGVCSVCGQGCNHNFNETVIAPTCTEDGYTLKTCTVCGTEEKTNLTVATGHTGTTTCTVCGASLVSGGFYTNLFESLVSGNFTIKLTDTYFTSKLRIENREINIDEIYFTVNDEGNLVGYGEFDTKFVDSESSQSQRAEFYIEGNKMYVKLEEKYAFEYTTGYVVLDLSSMAENGNISSALLPGAIGGTLGFLRGNLADIISVFATVLDSSVEEMTKEVVEFLFTAENKGDGTLYSINFDKIVEINENLYNNTVSELIDLVFGEGSFDAFTDGFEEIISMPISELPEKITSAGLTLSDVEEILDSLFGYTTESNEFVGIVEALKEEVDEEFETFADFFNTEYAKTHRLIDLDFGGNSSDAPMDPPSYDHEDSIGGGMGENTPIIKPVGPAPAKPASATDEDGDSKVEMVINSLKAIGEINIYEAMAEEMGVTKAFLYGFVEDQLELLSDSLSLSIKTNTQGRADEIKFIIDEYEIKEGDDFVISVNLLMTYGAQNINKYEEIKTAAINATNKQFDINDLFTSDKVTVENFDDYYLVTITDAVINGGLTDAFFDSDRYTLVYTEYIGIIEITIPKDSYIFMSNNVCGDVLYGILGSEYDTRTVTKITYRTYNYSGELLNEESTHTMSSPGGSPAGVFFDATLGKFVASTGYMAMGHNFTYDHSKSKAPIGCMGTGERHFVCTDCGLETYYTYTQGHKVVETATLLGESCNDGVNVKATCTVCGEIAYEYVYRYHETSAKIENLTFAGMCARHTIKRFSCVCEEMVYLEYDGFDYSMEDVEYCNECGFSVEETYRDRRENCIKYRDVTYTVKNSDGNTVFNLSGVYDYYTDHDYEMSVSLLGGAETCDDGVKITETCRDCGKTSSYQSSYHARGERERISLAPYGLDGAVIYSVCACGKERSLELHSDSRYVPDSYGSDTLIEGLYCEYVDCYRFADVTVEIKHCSMKSGCESKRYAFLFINDTKIGRYQLASTYSHVEKGVATMEGENCSDGVTIEFTCIICGNKRSSDYYYHVNYYKDIILTEEYGSVCGGYIGVRGCACGENNPYLMNDMDCDFDSERIYWHDEYNYLDVLTCAVTSPKCGFRYAVKRYSVESGCQKSCYLQVLVGCDENGENAKKTYTYTVSTRYTHEVDCYKPGDATRDVTCSKCGLTLDKITDIDWIKHSGINPGTQNDGMGGIITYSGDYCNHCGHGYEWRYDRDGNLYYESWIGIDIYYDGSTYDIVEETTSYTEYNGDYFKDVVRILYTEYIFNGAALLEADEYRNEMMEYFNFFEEGFDTLYHELFGREYNRQEDGCLAIIKGKGMEDVEVEDVCQVIFEHTKPTCTQDGAEYNYCKNCHKGYKNVYDPATGHFWEYDSYLGLYVCYECGLKNTNGADGDIILEDCSYMDGDADTLTVGYCNRGGIEFITSITIILSDGSEVLIEGIEFTYSTEGRYVTFSRSAVVAKATALGHRAGSYEIRISFIPVGAGTDLDYAITFEK